ncbi:Survival motor neuron protein [Eumeta japonica]|uniref:Survival motor neuron protein n=1 Tax=Eumeta variegata TaxID=151549 RepID=A0A4C1X980_EUMVA|nr:Survival motor neuron protein [Eumeta japonica]
MEGRKKAEGFKMLASPSVATPPFESDSEDNNDEGMWDDRTLNSAYERAMALEKSKVETAKRIAQATNTQKYDETLKTEESNNKKIKSGSARNSKKPNKLWAAGMYCRAVYKEDGREYEAIITRLLNDKECLITFLVRIELDAFWPKADDLNQSSVTAYKQI